MTYTIVAGVLLFLALVIMTLTLVFDGRGKRKVRRNFLAVDTIVRYRQSKRNDLFHHENWEETEPAEDYGPGFRKGTRSGEIYYSSNWLDESS